MRGEWIYIWMLVGLISLAVFLEVLGPKALDWTRSFERADDRPYGSEIIFAALPHLFDEVGVTDDPPYLVMNSMPDTVVNWCFVTTEFAADPAEVRRLISYVKAGNTVFVAAEQFRGALADTLNFKVHEELIPPFVGGEAAVDSVRLSLVGDKQQTRYAYKAGTIRSSFEWHEGATVLGVNEGGEATLIQIPIGEGEFILSTTPLAFTNYYMLHRHNAAYVYHVLSYLPASITWWDSHYKPLRALAATPLRYILSVPALRGGYTIGMLALVLFVLFRAKRTQRSIPIITPLRNETLDFVKTVGRLYYQRSDHTDLANKRISYFLEYVRSHLGVATNVIDETLVKRISQRAEIPLEQVVSLFALIRVAQEATTVSADQLKRLSSSLESFYHAAQR